MDRLVAHGARLILLRLVMHRPYGPWVGERVALQTQHVHQAHPQQTWIGRSMRRVAAGAAFCLYRHVLVDERTTLIGMALKADEVAVRQLTHLPQSCTLPCRLWQSVH